jgi:hypothetical protein
MVPKKGSLKKLKTCRVPSLGLDLSIFVKFVSSTEAMAFPSPPFLSLRCALYPPPLFWCEVPKEENMGRTGTPGKWKGVCMPFDLIKSK